MLSNEDIKKELGEEIYIFPFKEDNIRGWTINLSASNLAWTIGGKKIVHKDSQGKEQIIIPPNETAIIETEEVLYISYKLGGTYHSKVGMVTQ